MRTNQCSPSHSRSAAVIVLIVLVLPVVIAVAAYAINLAYMELVRTELQIATDLATRAAGRTFAVTSDQNEAVAKGQQIALLNPIGTLPVRLTSDDFVFGVSTRESEQERYLFTLGNNPNAVQIRTDNFASKNTPMLFPSLGMPTQFRPIKSAISTQSELDLALVLDRSGSMTFAADQESGAGFPNSWAPGQPVPPNSRWLDTVASVDLLLQQLVVSHQNERVSLVTYSTLAETDESLTEQYDLIREAMNQHSLQFLGGATNIGGGILEGLTSLHDKKTARPWASRVIILMSDGIHNIGVDPHVAAEMAAAEHTTIFTISFSDEADQQMMRDIATTCGGVHYHATSREQLSQAFDEILSRLPLLITY